MAIDEQKFLADQNWKANLLINKYGDTKVAGNPTSSPFSTDWRFDDGYDDIESYRGQPVFGVEEGGQTFFDFPFVKIRGNNNQKVASTPQDHPRYPNSPFYNTPNELKGVSPWIIDEFIKQKGKEIFKLNTGISLAHQDGGGFEHWSPEVKTDFLKQHDEEFQQWLRDNNLIIDEDKEEPGVRKKKNELGSLKIGTA